MGLFSFKRLWCAPTKCIISAIECVTAVHGHPRSMILVSCTLNVID